MVVSIRTSHRVSMKRGLNIYKIHLPFFFSILFNAISSLISPSESHFGIRRHFGIIKSNHNDIILLKNDKQAFNPFQAIFWSKNVHLQAINLVQKCLFWDHFFGLKRRSYWSYLCYSLAKKGLIYCKFTFVKLKWSTNSFLISSFS